MGDTRCVSHTASENPVVCDRYVQRATIGSRKVGVLLRDAAGLCSRRSHQKPTTRHRYVARYHTFPEGASCRPLTPVRRPGVARSEPPTDRRSARFGPAVRLHSRPSESGGGSSRGHPRTQREPVNCFGVKPRGFPWISRTHLEYHWDGAL